MQNNIKKYRTERGITLKEIGDAVGRSKSNIWHIEKGQYPNLSLTLAYGIAAVLGKKINEVFPDPNQYEIETETIKRIKVKHD